MQPNQMRLADKTVTLHSPALLGYVRLSFKASCKYVRQAVPLWAFCIEAPKARKMLLIKLKGYRQQANVAVTVQYLVVREKEELQEKSQCVISILLALLTCPDANPYITRAGADSENAQVLLVPCS